MQSSLQSLIGNWQSAIANRRTGPKSYATADHPERFSVPEILEADKFFHLAPGPMKNLPICTPLFVGMRIALPQVGFKQELLNLVQEDTRIHSGPNTNGLTEETECHTMNKRRAEAEL